MPKLFPAGVHWFTNEVMPTPKVKNIQLRFGRLILVNPWRIHVCVLWKKGLLTYRFSFQLNSNVSVHLLDQISWISYNSYFTLYLSIWCLQKVPRTVLISIIIPALRLFQPIWLQIQWQNCEYTNIQTSFVITSLYILALGCLENKIFLKCFIYSYILNNKLWSSIIIIVDQSFSFLG